jgi:hypothetical protein
VDGRVVLGDGSIGGLFEGGDNGGARDDVGVCDFGPEGNAVVAGGVLLLDSLANVGELAVFEDEERLALGNLAQGLGV